MGRAHDANSDAEMEEAWTIAHTGCGRWRQYDTSGLWQVDFHRFPSTTVSTTPSPGASERFNVLAFCWLALLL